MIIVLDASAAVEIVLSKPKSGKLRAILSGASWIISPDLFVPEVTNVFWKYHQFENLPISSCEKFLDLALAIPENVIDSTSLYKEAFAMSCMVRRPVCDMLYLVLARRHSAHFLTLDKELKKIAKKQSIRTA